MSPAIFKVIRSFYLHMMALSLLLMSPFASASIIIDFEGFAAGTVINSQYSGITVSANSNGSNDLAMIFDSANPTGGDSDLATPGYHPTNTNSLGNILIISEDGNSSDPDDEARGGTISFDFVSEVIMQSLGILDIDKNEGNGVEFFNLGSSVGSLNFAALGDNSFQEFDLDNLAITQMVVSFSSSGAITDFEYRVPEPAILSLFGVGLVGLGFARRRRMK